MGSPFRCCSVGRASAGTDHPIYAPAARSVPRFGRRKAFLRKRGKWIFAVPFALTHLCKKTPRGRTTGCQKYPKNADRKRFMCRLFEGVELLEVLSQEIIDGQARLGP